MKRGWQYLTSKIFVKSPKTPLEVLEAFQNEEIWYRFGVTKHQESAPLFKACIQEDNFSYCIFSSDKIKALIKEYIPPKHRTYLLDGTFNIVPQGCFKQLLILYINYFDEKVSKNLIIMKMMLLYAMVGGGRRAECAVQQARGGRPPRTPPTIQRF